MRQKSGPVKELAEKVVKDIRRATRRHFSAEDKIRIVLEGLRGEESIVELCRREGIVQNLYYRWSKDFLEAGKKRLAGDTARAATSDEVKDLRREASALKEVVAELTLENRLLGERLRDEQAGEQKFYTARAERILFTAIMAPSGAPEWAHDRNRLWNEAERTEKRKDAQLAREFEVALPQELTAPQREWLVKDFAREAFARQGYVADIAIHAPDATSDERNHHAHIMVTMRTLGPDGFAAKKDRSLNSTEQLDAWREQWAHLANRHLERHGHDARIDHRSLEAQGIEREPTVHLGYAALEMDKRGAQSDRMDALREVLARSEIRLEMKAIDRELIVLERVADRQAEPRQQAERAAPAPEAFAGREESRAMDGAARGLDGVASGVARVADGLATFASRAIEFLADFFGGASAPPPTKEQGQAAAPPAPEPPPFAGIAAPELERRRQTLQEYEQDVLQRMKAMQELSRLYGREVISEADARMQEESDKKRSRDRGGGQSL